MFRHVIDTTDVPAPAGYVLRDAATRDLLLETATLDALLSAAACADRPVRGYMRDETGCEWCVSL